MHPLKIVILFLSFLFFQCAPSTEDGAVTAPQRAISQAPSTGPLPAPTPAPSPAPAPGVAPTPGQPTPNRCATDENTSFKVKFTGEIFGDQADQFHCPNNDTLSFKIDLNGTLKEVQFTCSAAVQKELTISGLKEKDNILAIKDVKQRAGTSSGSRLCSRHCEVAESINEFAIYQIEVIGPCSVPPIYNNENRDGSLINQSHFFNPNSISVTFDRP